MEERKGLVEFDWELLEKKVRLVSDLSGNKQKNRELHIIS